MVLQVSCQNEMPSVCGQFRGVSLEPPQNYPTPTDPRCRRKWRGQRTLGPSDQTIGVIIIILSPQPARAPADRLSPSKSARLHYGDVSYLFESSFSNDTLVSISIPFLNSTIRPHGADVSKKSHSFPAKTRQPCGGVGSVGIGGVEWSSLSIRSIEGAHPVKIVPQIE